MNKWIPCFYALLVFAASCNHSGETGHQPHTPPKTMKENIDKPKAPVFTGLQRILFIGNSYTSYYVSIPQQFAELCAANKITMQQEQLTAMGASLQEVYSTNRAKADELFARADSDGNYFDYVVIQEKTPVVIQDLGQYRASVKMLLEKIKKNSPAIATYLYQVASPAPYRDSKAAFEQYHETIKKNTMVVLAENSNTGVYRVGDAIKDAYEGRDGYRYQVNGKDNLRYGQDTQHLLNDGGFLASTLLYITLFNSRPALPAAMTFSAGTGDQDGQRSMSVKVAVSNPDALLAIAQRNR